MFERFTDRARKVIVLAQAEAKRLNHDYIGTEHLLLGLIREGEGVAVTALRALGISLQDVQSRVEDLIRQGRQEPSGHIPFTPRAKMVMELSLREALELKHRHIGTEHLLLGLIREEEGVAAQVLTQLGADTDSVRQQVITLLARLTADEPAHSAGQDVPGAVRSRLWAKAVMRFESFDQRLAALERWTGLRPATDDLDEQISLLRHEKEAAIDRQEFEVAARLRAEEKGLMADREARVQQWADELSSRPPLSGEVSELKAEVERLRTMLREHGIDS